MCVTFYYDSVHAIVTVNCSLFPQFTHHFSKRGCDLNVSSKECHGRARSRSRSAAGSEVVHTPEHGVFVGPPRLVAETSEYDTLLSQPEKQKRKPDNAKAQRGGKNGTVLKKPVSKRKWFNESIASAEVFRLISQNWPAVRWTKVTAIKATNQSMQLLDMWAWQMVSDAAVLLFFLGYFWWFYSSVFNGFLRFPQLAKSWFFMVFSVFPKLPEIGF